MEGILSGSTSKCYYRASKDRKRGPEYCLKSHKYAASKRDQWNERIKTVLVRCVLFPLLRVKLIDSRYINMVTEVHGKNQGK